MRTNNRISVVIGILVAWMIVCGGGRLPADTAASRTPGGTTMSTVQTQCPVEANQNIDPRIHSDYKGRRVYFCCLSCKAKFDKEPEKYLSRLPQFSAGASRSEGEEHGRHEMFLGEFIEPTGVTTLILLIATVCLALLRRVRRPKPGLILTLHKTAGVCTLISGLAHATLVILH